MVEETTVVPEVEVEAPIEPKGVGNEVIVPGPVLAGEYAEKKLKVVRKEGGKKGVEIEGAADMGGLQFFVTTVATPENDLDLLVECMVSMNAISDPSEEERKGGAGKIGKMLLCQTEEFLNIVAYVPSHQTECVAEEWLTHVVHMLTGPSNAPALKTWEGIASKSWSAVSLGKNPEKNLFPLKMRDTAINEGIGFLKRKGLFPDDDDDDDEMVFGDEDFPS